MAGAIRRHTLVLAAAALVLAGATAWSWNLMQPEAPPDADTRAWVEVTRVRSGHKLIVEPDDEVILAGVRSPYGDEPMHDDARERLEALVGGKELRLRFDDDERDRNERLLAYAFLDGQFVNSVVVREGLGYVRLTPDTRRFAEELLAAQKEARRERLGIWGLEPPPPESEYLADPKYGNFHRASCEEIPNINPERIRRFTERGALFDQGFAPCNKCRP